MSRLLGLARTVFRLPLTCRQLASIVVSSVVRWTPGGVICLRAWNIFDSSGDYPLSRFCAERSIPYDDERLPVQLQTFVEYGVAFQDRFVSGLEEKHVESVRQDSGGFVLTLDDGAFVRARRVVVAVGIGHFRYLPAALGGLPPQFVSHSYDHHDLSPVVGNRVAVVGGGASAIDLAGLLHECGCDVQLICRCDALKFASPPTSGERSLWRRLRYPRSGLGPGLKSRLCTDAPLLFHFMPETLRLEFVRRHLGPAAGWPMKDKVIGRVPVQSGYEVASAAISDSCVTLEMRRRNGESTVARFDHIIAATGYRVDVRRLDFLDQSLLSRLAHVYQTPILSARFESSVQGLFFVGPIAANSFGPLLRFAFGAQFASRRVMSALERPPYATSRRPKSFKRLARGAHAATAP